MIINFKDSGNTEDYVPFCLSKPEFINIRYKNLLEKYVIFSSLYQLKIGAECNQYFVEGTFKATPKGYFQIFNIWVKRKSQYIFTNCKLFIVT